MDAPQGKHDCHLDGQQNHSVQKKNIVMPRADPAVIASLRARIWALERSAAAATDMVAVAPAIDAALPWGGLPLGCLHDVIAGDESATGFLAVLLGRLTARGPVLWCVRRDARQALYPPGVSGFGLAADHIIVVRGAAPRDLLWAAEEGLRCRKLTAVVLEGVEADLTAGRRLQLAAESGGITGFTLMPDRARPSGAATSRWRIRSAASAPTPWQGIGAPRWHVALERCRNGGAGAWLVEWREDERRLVVL